MVANAPFLSFKEGILINIVEKISINKNEICSVTGHRPSDKYNTKFMFDFKNVKTLEIRDKLLVEFENLILKENIKGFITGGALGFDQICFWVVEILKKKYPYIKNILAIPFEKFNYSWKAYDCKQCFYISKNNEDFKSNKCNKCTFKNTQELYYKMLNRADEVILVDTKEGYKFDKVEIGEYHVSKLNIRNKYLVDFSVKTIAYYNGMPSGTGNCIKYAIEKNHKIINIF